MCGRFSFVTDKPKIKKALCLQIVFMNGATWLALKNHFAL